MTSIMKSMLADLALDLGMRPPGCEGEIATLRAVPMTAQRQDPHTGQVYSDGAVELTVFGGKTTRRDRFAGRTVIPLEGAARLEASTSWPKVLKRLARDFVFVKGPGRDAFPYRIFDLLNPDQARSVSPWIL